MTKRMMKPLKLTRTALMCALVGMSLSACTKDKAIGGPIAQVGFQHLQQIRLNVAKINVKSNYKGPMLAPNVEQQFPTSPERAMFDWALTRLVSVGGAPDYPAIALFEIQDASVIETNIAKTEGLKGMFTYEPTTRYDANAVATLSIKNHETGASGTVKVTAARSAEVSENATLAQREEVWMELVEKMMADFNAQMELQIQGYLARWADAPGLK